MRRKSMVAMAAVLCLAFVACGGGEGTKKEEARGGQMGVYSIWESQFPPEAAPEGREVTERIWVDMLGFEGYLGHELLQDLDDPGHLLVVSRWDSRARADQALAQYRDNPNAVEANRLVASPRRRFVAVERTE